MRRRESKSMANARRKEERGRGGDGARGALISLKKED